MSDPHPSPDEAPEQEDDKETTRMSQAEIDALLKEHAEAAEAAEAAQAPSDEDAAERS